MKEKFKNLEIDGEQYALKKLDCMSSMEVLSKIISKLQPVLNDLKEDSDDTEAVGAIISCIGSLSRNDIDVIVKNCLCNVSKVMPAGFQRIMYPNGTFGIEDVECDLGLTLKLCGAEIMWSIGDFFAGKSLDSIIGELEQITSKLSQ